MSVSKRLRFEVFKRDGFQCGYCGRTPPDILLECDHVHPKSKGGKDDINNLITACFTCNRGKADILLTSVPRQLGENIDALRERENQLVEYNNLLAQIESRLDTEIQRLNDRFEHFTNHVFMHNFAEQKVRFFLKKLPFMEVVQALDVALSRVPGDKPNGVLKYWCACCWRSVREGNQYV